MSEIFIVNVPTVVSVEEKRDFLTLHTRPLTTLDCVTVLGVGHHLEIGKRHVYHVNMILFKVSKIQFDFK